MAGDHDFRKAGWERFHLQIIKNMAGGTAAMVDSILKCNVPARAVEKIE
jgi:hypothetical protein